MEKVFVLAPDSFKESMSAKKACEAMERGIRKVLPKAEIHHVPMADGGEGTVDALVDGSATNDGGAGMAQALGIRLLDKENNELPVGGGALSKLAKIDVTTIDPRIADTEIIIASDVTNPLTGPNGASVVFAPQKGATAGLVEKLEENLVHYAQVIKKELGIDIKNHPGAGAAGGLGAGLLVFTGAKMRSGIELVIELTHLEEMIVKADYVFTGEGSIDYQTKFGKAPYGVAKLAEKHQKPVFACAGHMGEHVETLYEEGMTAIFSILSKPSSLEDALKKGEENLEQLVENIVRVLCIK